MKCVVNWIGLHIPWTGNHDIWRTEASIFCPLNTSEEWDITAPCKTWELGYGYLSSTLRPCSKLRSEVWLHRYLLLDWWVLRTFPTPRYEWEECILNLASSACIKDTKRFCSRFWKTSSKKHQLWRKMYVIGSNRRMVRDWALKIFWDFK